MFLRFFCDIICVGEFETFLTALHCNRKNKTKGKSKYKMKRTNKLTLYVTRGALIAAIYVVMTMLASAVGLSSGTIQLRISEALCILPVFRPEATVGLTLGCLVSNLITGGHILDIVFGTLATLLGALGTRALLKWKNFPFVLYTLPSVISNAIIVPLVLCYTLNGGYSHAFFFPTMGSVALGEGVVSILLGTLLYLAIRKRPSILGL